MIFYHEETGLQVEVVDTPDIQDYRTVGGILYEVTVACACETSCGQKCLVTDWDRGVILAVDCYTREGVVTLRRHLDEVAPCDFCDH